MKMNMKIFVTGIAGFIGFQTAIALKKKGHAVSGCDNFNNYYDVSLKRKRASLLKEAGIEVFEKSIQEIESLAPFFEKTGLTHIIHLAAQAGIRYSVEHPDLFTEDNLVGFMSILEFCKKRPSLKLIYASSSSVYGMRNDEGFSEEDVTDYPTNLYGATKKCNELLAHAYYHCFKIQSTGLRFFTVYGPWGRPDMAVGLFMKNIHAGIPITLYDPDKMERDFTYIDDIVSGIEASLHLDGYHIINLGDSERHKIVELVELMEKEFGKKAIVRTESAPVGEVFTSSADITLARKLLQYEPKVPLALGIKLSVQWYLTLLETKR